jgi:hypothetical protein
MFVSMAHAPAKADDLLANGFFIAQTSMDVPEALKSKRAILRAQDNDRG